RVKGVLETRRWREGRAKPHAQTLTPPEAARETWDPAADRRPRLPNPQPCPRRDGLQRAPVHGPVVLVREFAGWPLAPSLARRRRPRWRERGAFPPLGRDADLRPAVAEQFAHGPELRVQHRACRGNALGHSARGPRALTRLDARDAGPLEPVLGRHVLA